MDIKGGLQNEHTKNFDKLGLKELVLPKGFNQRLDGQLPPTLHSLSILNTDYDKELVAACLPTTLTSLTCWCMSKSVVLDLSLHRHLVSLDVYSESVVSYPPLLESLVVRDAYDANAPGIRINRDLIKKLAIVDISRVVQDDQDQDYSAVFEDDDDGDYSAVLPNLRYLKTNSVHSDRPIPSSVEVLDLRDYHYTLKQELKSHIKQLHLSTTTSTLQRLVKPLPIATVSNNIAIYNQTLPMIDGYFKLWRNVYIRSKILDSLYDLIRTDLKFNSDGSLLQHMDRFGNYNIQISNSHQLGTVKQYTPETITLGTEGVKLDFAANDVIPTSARKLRCHYFPHHVYPSWITHLSLESWSEMEWDRVPSTVTNLTLYNKKQKVDFQGKLTSSVAHVRLDCLDGVQRDSIPASVTRLTLVNEPVNSCGIQAADLPATIERIQFINLSIDDKNSHEIPVDVASRLVNGVFYVYSKSTARVPPNTTHLFWVDNRYICCKEVTIPRSVHTLVLNHRFNSAILSLPPTITQMVFNGEFKQPLSAIAFPPSLRYLCFNHLEETIKENDLPNGLSHLKVNVKGRGGFDSLPKSVHHLELSFNGDLSSAIPENVRHLKFNYTRIMTSIPPTVQSIITSQLSKISFRQYGSFKDPLPPPFDDNILVHLHPQAYIFGKLNQFNRFIQPYSLGTNIKSISFGDEFNQVILVGTIPNSVEYLDFGRRFNQKLSTSVLPTNLEVLKLGPDFDQDLNDDLFPSSLTELVLHTTPIPRLESLVRLRKLVCKYYDGVLKILPNTVDDLEFLKPDYKPKYPRPEIEFPIQLVPPSITRLVLHPYMYIQSYDLIPLSIKSITLCESIQPSKIPHTIESVQLPHSFNRPLDTILQTD
ncbi:hypothetical protein CYY_003578 [Polysphondylium violaceum]|uniref:FNIP repeat-containing protein n=1 Tax=Polysphondylium violaceum TaxID=133409 RepID=A0A8J4Q6M3_9MYCE|nr:hypothetical protein CYY_003578 [Polysphondylium violaceum]